MASMEDLADHINNVICLPLIMDKPTPGKGNCFFAAICQQLNHRTELNASNVYNAAQLRKQVCDFALAKSHPLVQKLATEHDQNAVPCLRVPWESLFTNMKKNGVFAEGPVLNVTALLLQLDIAVLSFGNTALNPYLLVPGHCPTPAPPPIYVGNLINLHFQSFLVDAGATKTELEKLDAPPAPMLSPKKVFTSQQTTPTLSGQRKLFKRKALLSSPSDYPQKKKSLLNIREVARMGDSAIETILLLVKENRRMHALMQSLEFRLQHCECGIYAGEMGGTEKLKVKRQQIVGEQKMGTKCRINLMHSMYWILLMMTHYYPHHCEKLCVRRHLFFYSIHAVLYVLIF